LDNPPRRGREKTRVVWDFPREHIDGVLFENDIEAKGPDDDDDDDDDAARMEVVLATPVRAQRPWEESMAAALERTCPLYGDGTEVHYYSCTQQAWIPGVLHLTLSKPICRNQPPSVIYNVVLLTGQRREDVQFQQIRLPFNDGDPVEILSNHTGNWLAGSVLPPSREGVGGKRSIFPLQVFPQYRVVVTGSSSKNIFGEVPPERLRRRFLPRQVVVVYCGWPRGWVPAIVHIHRPQELPSQETVDETRCEDFQRTFETAPADTGFRTTSDHEKDMKNFWTLVPVVEIDIDGIDILSTDEGLFGEGADAILEREPTWTPSYFIRAAFEEEVLPQTYDV
jgi:hypothetical protein